MAKPMVITAFLMLSHTPLPATGRYRGRFTAPAEGGRAGGDAQSGSHCAPPAHHPHQ
jgi:hypothetical protein